jgi:hypothetical protein
VIFLSTSVGAYQEGGKACDAIYILLEIASSAALSNLRVSIRKSCERAYYGNCRYLSAYRRICMPSGSRNPLTQPRGVSITGGCQMSSASRCSIH